MASTDFTKKLRTAIKTKIQELGIEADDELPDYIMIMIANKKDKPRMKNDLMLFLSDNTDAFVDWLFEFFDKVNKKDVEELKKEVDPKPKRERRYSEERPKTRSRSPVRRSRSPPRRPRHDEDKSSSRRQPIRAPSPGRAAKNRRRSRSRSVEDDRRRRGGRDDRKKIVFSDSDEDSRKVRSTVISNRSERHTPPKVNSQVVVKKRKADQIEEKAASSLFKRALTDSLKDDAPRRKIHRGDDVLQVNTAKSTRRTILVDDLSDVSEDEEPETQFIVKMNKAAALRKTLRTQRMTSAENAAEHAGLHGRRQNTERARAFLKLSGIKAKSNAQGGEMEELTRKKMLMAVAAQGASWDGKISVDDDDDISLESDNDEAEIDAFLADSMIPPTVSLSRPVMPLPHKKQFGSVQPKAPEVGKIPERCRFYPNCRNENSCMYSHPSKPCINFPSCWFGEKCLFIHPKCRFEPNCTKPGCPYIHTMPRTVVSKPLAPKQPHILSITSPEKDGESSAVGAGGDVEKSEKENEQGSAEDASQDGDQKSEANVKSEESVADSGAEGKSDEKPDVPLTVGAVTAAATAPRIKPMNTTNSSAPCRYGPNCRAEACPYRHPKKCRYDESCTNEMCHFWHPKKNAGRFRWTKN